MATIKVRNVSGTELLVPLPGGGDVTVPANHQHEFDAEHARALLDQPDNWQRVKTDTSTSERDTAS